MAASSWSKKLDDARRAVRPLRARASGDRHRRSRSACSAKVRHAGAIFLGRHTPEAMGDYIAGPNHVLPTSRSARFSSGLSVLDFMKRTTLLSLDAGAIAALGPRRHRPGRGRRAGRPCPLHRRAAEPETTDVDHPHQRHHPGRETAWCSRTPAIEQEREVAISDLLEANHFQPKGSPGGPYRLTLSVKENRLVFDIALRRRRSRMARIILSLTPFRRIDQGLFPGLRKLLQGDPHRAAAADRGARHGPPRAARRRHRRFCMKRLEGKIETDFDTARRLFTLICVLHLKG